MTTNPHFVIRNVAPKVAEIDLLDGIGGWWGVEASELIREIRDIDADEIRLNINSPGGSVFDGVAILNALRQHPAKVVANVLGLAASAASFIAVGCDEVVMADNSTMMIHDASGVVVGNAQDMSEMSDLLDMLSDNIASIYAAKAGGTAQEWRATMRGEKWYTADAAVEAGLADRVDQRPAVEPSKDAENHSSRPASVDDARAALAVSQQLLAPAASAAIATAHVSVAPMPPSSSEPVEHNPQKGVTMGDILKSGLHNRLGIQTPCDDMTDEQLLAAVDEALAEQVVEQAPAALVPEGTVLIESEQLDALRADAAAGRAARDEQVRQQRAQVVEAAIADGRIAPARRDHWMAALDADEEGAKALLNSLAKGLVPLEAAGSAGAPESDGDLARKAGWNTEEN